jgi:hypothetical protein
MDRSDVHSPIKVCRCGERRIAAPVLHALASLLLLGSGVVACGSGVTFMDTATATVQPTTTVRLAPTQAASTSASATPTAFATLSPQTSTPVPPRATPATSSGPFRLVARLAPDLSGPVIGLHVTPDGEAWVLTTGEYVVLREGERHVEPLSPSEIPVGVDDAGRVWLVSEDGSRIGFREDGTEPMPMGDGWSPVPDPGRLAGRGLLPDDAGNVWLLTDQDVRRFDGVRWTVYASEDMGMAAPADPDFYTEFVLEPAGEPGQVWVGRCDWGGPGPAGGGGARRFDGNAWYGANSPVATGCVTAIKKDSLGRVWVGLDADLWRYDSASAFWQRFAPPPAPTDRRLGYIFDLSLDAASEPWPLFALCGGASCVDTTARYRLHDGRWMPIGEIDSEVQNLVFDGEGAPWLLLGGLVYRIDDDRLVEPPVTSLTADAVAVDTSGQVWVAGAPPGGETALWLLESEPDAVDLSAICPSPAAQPPPFPEAREGQSIAEMFEPQIRAYLNAGGEAQALQAGLADLALTDSDGQVWQARSQVFTTDVTGDATAEVVMDLSFFVEGQYADGALFVFRCQAGQYAGGAVEHIGAQVLTSSDPDPGIRAIQDMNGNGTAEIVFSYILVVGTHANFTREFRIVEWDGSHFVDLVQSDGNHSYAAEVLNGDGIVYDTNGDGLLELELTHGLGHGIEASGPERADSDVWAWDGQAFALAYTRAAWPPVFRIRTVWDGDNASLRGDYAAALALYQQAILDDALLGWSPGYFARDATPDPNERQRLSAYSHYRMLLLHLVRDHLPEAQMTYDTLQEEFPEEAVGHPYAQLATVFWTEYQTGRDVAAACGRAVDYAAANADQILAPLGGGFYGSGYAPEAICPFK